MPRREQFHAVRIDTAIYEALNKMREASEYKYMPANTYIETLLQKQIHSLAEGVSPTDFSISPGIIETIQEIAKKEKRLFNAQTERLIESGIEVYKERNKSTPLASDVPATHGGTTLKSTSGFIRHNGQIYVPMPVSQVSGESGEKEWLTEVNPIHGRGHVSPVLLRDKAIADRLKRESQIHLKGHRS